MRNDEGSSDCCGTDSGTIRDTIVTDSTFVSESTSISEANFVNDSAFAFILSAFRRNPELTLTERN